jgi:hypothetical protein
MHLTLRRAFARLDYWPEAVLKPVTLSRVASILLVLFAVLHTLGFRQVDPEWGVDSLVNAMRSSHFNIFGSTRTYWDFFVGFGFFLSLFLVFSAVLTWQLSNLSRHNLAVMRGPSWALVACFAAVTIVSFRYAFIVPTALSVAILLCVTLAAVLAGKATT